jgi:hypothetical protein
MNLFNPVILRRLGFWALIQALPSESALKAYLKSVFLALCTAVIGSILLGALTAAGMIVMYQALVTNGIEAWIAGSTTAGAALLLLISCVILFLRALRQISQVQTNETEVRQKALANPVSRLTDALRDGFSSGYQRSAR